MLCEFVAFAFQIFIILVIYETYSILAEPEGSTNMFYSPKHNLFMHCVYPLIQISYCMCTPSIAWITWNNYNLTGLPFFEIYKNNRRNSEKQ